MLGTAGQKTPHLPLFWVLRLIVAFIFYKLKNHITCKRVSTRSHRKEFRESNCTPVRVHWTPLGWRDRMEEQALLIGMGS
jgi:hypothetical protein